MKNATKIITLLLALVMVITVTASCGSKEKPANDTAAEVTDSSSIDTSSVDTSSGEATEAEKGIHPYAWLGLEDMPKCSYLDIIAANHYIQEIDYYTMSIVLEQTEAVDGINTYTANENTRQYSIDGHVYTLNGSTKKYMESDASSAAAMAKASLEAAIADGTNIKQREFVKTGKEAIPLYSDKTGDTAEYEYYEYLTDSSTESTTIRLTERFYMKDGDVFAIYQNSEMSTISIESLKVIKSISADIPEGLLQTPDLTGYEPYN